jgi:hypothetical protein
LAYVKDKSKNLTTLNLTMSIVVSYDVLQLEKPFLAHVISKVCLHVTNEEKVCQGMKVSLENPQSTLQKTITWTKKSSKGRQEWEAPC